MSLIRTRRFVIPGLTPTAVPKHETDCAGGCGALNPGRTIVLCPVCRSLLEHVRANPALVPKSEGRSGLDVMFDAWTEKVQPAVYMLTGLGFEKVGVIDDYSAHAPTDGLMRCEFRGHCTP